MSEAGIVTGSREHDAQAVKGCLRNSSEYFMVCHNCGREVKLVGKALRSDECPHCKADIHCCKNCRFFDPGKSNQCSEPQADYVRDKVKVNYCDYFQPNNRLPLTKRGSEPVQRDDVRKNLDRLFKPGKSQADKSDDARSAFDKLFKK